MTENNKIKTNNKINTNKVITFGCRLNSYESSVIENILDKANLSNITVINSCAVTNEAERQVRQAIRKEKKENPDNKIFVTGCVAQINSKSLLEMKEVDCVFGNYEKMLNEIYSDDSSKIKKAYISDSDRQEKLHIISNFSGKARAYVKIQNGCDHRCTFCTIPLARGKSRSIPICGIKDQIEAIINAGYKEIVLTGVDLTHYGADLPGKPTLGSILKRLFDLIPDFNRVRLSSLDPIEIDDDLWSLIESDNRILPHFHISIQSGDDVILKRMGRRHLRKDLFNVIERIYKHRPDAAIGTDIIVGFPTEKEENFLNTFNLVKECKIPLLHVFPFSKRNNTPASKMQQLSGRIIKERAKRLRELGEKNYQEYLNNWKGRAVKALIEKIESNDKNNDKKNDNKRIIFAKTDHFIPITIIQSKDAVNNSEGYSVFCDPHINSVTLKEKDLVNLNVIGVEKDYLLGAIIS